MAHWRLQKDRHPGKTTDSTQIQPPEAQRHGEDTGRKQREVFILRDGYKGYKVDGCNSKGKSFKIFFLFMCVSDCGFVQVSAVFTDVVI